MNCRSFSTTPPSLLFPTAAGFSSRCINGSHSKEWGAAGNVVLPLHPKLSCCSLNEGHYHSVFSPCCLCFYVYVHTRHTCSHPSQHRSVISDLLVGQYHVCLPKCLGVGCPCPPSPVPNLCEEITNYVDHALNVVLQQLY